ncbi:hypothetical protein MAR_033031 [Mya arenaria]|uniref:B box-type domain-containing protein n=1 Tax=Mya arenaria TaxID=6604 RepID=A0ABY7GAV6_MYAAR|nr:hypothetical protein MAR_033031 [Mya arenaria]
MAFRGKSIDKDYILIHDYSCCKCEENDLSAEAQHFCPQCEHYLCDRCVRMHRDYFKKHIVYGRGEIQKWVRFSIDRCEQHGKELEVHCDDHQELCCCLCVALNHRLCSSISHLPDLARGFLKTAKFRQIPEAMDEISRRLDELKNTRVKDQASVNDTYNNFMAQIKALRKEINKILDKLENDTVKHFESIIKDLKKDVKDDLENCDRMNDQLETMFDMLQQITDKHKETSTYISFKKCQTKLSEAYSLVQEIQKRPNCFDSCVSVHIFVLQVGHEFSCTLFLVDQKYETRQCHARLRKLVD